MPKPEIKEIQIPGGSNISAMEVNFENYVRPVSKVVDSVGVESWFIMSENLKDWVEIDPEQLWYWTKEWQAGEQAADNDLDSGDYEEFDDLSDLLK